MRRFLTILLLLPALAQAARWSDAEVAGLVTDPAMAEISGFAASRAHPGVYWAHNDGDNRAELHAMDERGRRRGTLAIEGVRNIDWEDIASFTLEGRHYLAIADTGDNGGIRRQLRLIVVEEPAQADGRSTTSPAWIVRVRWPDGPRDCEALAVDAAAGQFLLVSKKRVPPELFRVPLRPQPQDGEGDGSGVEVAQAVGLLAGVVQPTSQDLERNPIYGRYRSQITAADLSPNGRVLAVMNYREIYLYRRDPGQDWGAAVTRAPGRLVLPWLPQAEALAFSSDGRALLVGSEQLPAPLVRFRVQDAPPRP